MSVDPECGLGLWNQSVESNKTAIPLPDGAEEEPSSYCHDSGVDCQGVDCRGVDCRGVGLHPVESFSMRPALRSFTPHGSAGSFHSENPLFRLGPWQQWQ